jgi:hypothetical protein
MTTLLLVAGWIVVSAFVATWFGAMVMKGRNRRR